MSIEEMKAKGFKRYTTFLERVISTGAIEIWARESQFRIIYSVTSKSCIKRQRRNKSW